MIKTQNLMFQGFINYPDIEILEHKVNFITGESGCGKSTLLKLINKTEKFSQGDIFLWSKPIAEYESIALRKKIKLISQTSFLFKGTIMENFSQYYRYCGEKRPTEEKMECFLQMTHGNFGLNESCDTLSGGEKQRVYIAICLSMEADVIMLDEPTSALDWDLAVAVLENIIKYAKDNKKTMIVISHDAALEEKFSENTISLTGGVGNE